ncbi:GtrA family protein [Curtobacterium flaccumfaciens pv. beticola]|uniref:GtrA family protein n=1 Tax=Curtobacterium TaxID=2034 RepID=UPI002542E28D|nr:GtrA family protein [Curtobacterium citreum]MCS5486625.1 GtrA family protein [Curtobacterium flaccumfaciens pv. basellae]MDK8171966.1 GtrA family protein [Curtobacterium citreum]WIJ46301.1 GtrA family protein [Curtobacterium citreum]
MTRTDTPVLVPCGTGSVPTFAARAAHPAAPAGPAATADAPTVASRLRAGATQLASFGAIGAVCFLIDLGVYNLLRATVLSDGPIAAKILSAVVATVVAWQANRSITFRSQRQVGGKETLREGFLFAVTNVLGLGIAAACLFVSHYVLGFTSTLADNVAGNGVGLVLGTAFRFAAYKALVFRSTDAHAKEHLA